MSAVLPRKFVNYQLRFGLQGKRLAAAQIVKLQNPWDRLGTVIETATPPASNAPSSFTQGPVPHGVPSPPRQALQQQGQHKQQQQQQQAQVQQGQHTQQRFANGQQRQGRLKQQQLDDGQQRWYTPFPTTQAQLRKLTPPVVLQAELEAFRKMGLQLARCSALRKELQGTDAAEIEVKIPKVFAQDARLSALIQAMEKGAAGSLRIKRLICKAKVLEHR